MRLTEVVRIICVINLSNIWLFFRQTLDLMLCSPYVPSHVSLYQSCCDHYFPDLSSSPPGPYQQDAYVIKSDDKLKHPPILPPHLLQVLLNKDTGVSVCTQEQNVPERCKYRWSFINILLSSESSPVRPDVASRTKPCDAQPPVCSVHQGNKSSFTPLIFNQKSVT